MKNADVAVVVPVFNRPTIVLETLDSIARQSLLPRRLIVVDDGSTDHTAASVRRWIKHLDVPLEAQVIEQDNRGAAAARNRGMAAVEGCEFVAFLDSDDLWPADFLERTYPLLLANPLAVAATCDQLRTDFQGNQIGVKHTQPLARDATRWIFLTNGELASCSLFRFSTIKRLGGYDEHLVTSQDAALFLRVSLLGPWLHAAGTRVTYRCGLAAHRGEEGHLSRKHADNYFGAAMVREAFLEHGGRGAIPRAVYRRCLARRWYKAGRQLLASGRRLQAQRCLRRAVEWEPWHPKAWLRLAEAYLRRAA